MSTDSNFVSEAAQDDTLVSRVLGTAVLVMLVYASVGAIILSINSFWERRNDKREREMIQQKLREIPGRKTMTDDGPPVKTATGKVVPGPPLSGNRESRRIEKKMKEKELREQRKREKQALAKGTKKDDDSKS